MAKKKSKKKHNKSQQVNLPKSETLVKKQAKKRIAAKSLAEEADNKIKVSTTQSRVALLIIGLIIIILIGIIIFLFGQTQLVRDNVVDTGQDELLKVQPAAGDSLQPTQGTDTNPQQSAPSPQGSNQDSQQLQQPASPDQSANQTP